MKASIVLAAVLAMAGLTGCIKGEKNFMYVTGRGTNEVFGFTLHANGTITALGTPNFATGSQPASLAVHQPGDFIYIANSAGNNLTQLNINRSNGELTIPPTNSAIPPVVPPNIFGTGATPVSVVVSPTGPFVYALNQASGNISAFLLDPSTGSLSLITNPPGNPSGALPTYGTFTGPVAMAVSPKGSALFVVSPSQGLFSMPIDNSKGQLGAQSTPLPAGTNPSSITVESTGQFLYVTDSASNAVFAFSIGSNGALAAVAGSPFAAGAGPTASAVDATGNFLYVANKNDNTISAFLIKPDGTLSAVPGSPFASSGRGPGFVAATASFLYVADQTTNDISVFSIANNGALSPVAGSPFPVPVSPEWITLQPQAQ
ncbi:MAG TPA: beta-propeller fold lactonase family protein [Candidatus Limnocylindrales bacterium]|nr:beta-propeller fold lactonase family protein [Candidatus Limnocylindrales bacterium]